MTDPFAALSKMGFGSWSKMPLKGDASSRQFLRLSDKDGQTAIAMYTPPSLAQSQHAFVLLSKHLISQGISAPRILGKNLESGLVVLEDLGTTDLATCLDQHPDGTAEYYRAAIDVITTLRATPSPAFLPHLTADLAMEMLDPFFDFYAKQSTSAQQQDLRECFHPILASVLEGNPVLALRDYHVENLIWRSDKIGLDRVGVLDFQDAFSAPSEYDLASLLRDARRDVSPDARRDGIDYFAQSTNQDPEIVGQRCAVLSVQRNLRILGIFWRLAERDGKPGYLRFIPRVRDYILSDIRHPALMPLIPVLSPLLLDGHA